MNKPIEHTRKTTIEIDLEFDKMMSNTEPGNLDYDVAHEMMCDCIMINLGKQQLHTTEDFMTAVKVISLLYTKYPKHHTLFSGKILEFSEEILDYMKANKQENTIH